LGWGWFFRSNACGFVGYYASFHKQHKQNTLHLDILTWK
jgi:hypothetical protein